MNPAFRSTCKKCERHGDMLFRSFCTIGGKPHIDLECPTCGHRFYCEVKEKKEQ